MQGLIQREIPEQSQIDVAALNLPQFIVCHVLYVLHGRIALWVTEAACFTSGSMLQQPARVGIFLELRKGHGR
mgnify:CR=1 FL=1